VRAVDGLADVIKVGLIPECAMQVTSSEEGGELFGSPRARRRAYNSGSSYAILEAA
jgi:hypothetical protein